jgi:hypothetical protein
MAATLKEECLPRMARMDTNEYKENIATDERR